MNSLTLSPSFLTPSGQRILISKPGAQLDPPIKHYTKFGTFSFSSFGEMVWTAYGVRRTGYGGRTDFFLFQILVLDLLKRKNTNFEGG